MGPVGLFLRFRLVLSPVPELGVRASLVPLIGQGDQAGGLQSGQDAPDPLGFLVVDRAGERPGHPHDAAVRAGDDLQALLQDPGRELYGLELSEQTGLLPGTVYPILQRLEEAGLATSRHEEVDPHAVKRRGYPASQIRAAKLRQGARTDLAGRKERDDRDRSRR